MIRVTAFEWKAAGQKQILYVGADKHIHVLSKSTFNDWTHLDLNDKNVTGAPEVPDSAIPVGFEWTAGESKEVYFVTGDGHIQELHKGTGNQWAWADLHEKFKNLNFPLA